MRTNNTFIDFTSVISFGLSVFKADMAASRAGIASAREVNGGVKRYYIT